MNIWDVPGLLFSETYQFKHFSLSRYKELAFKMNIRVPQTSTHSNYV